MANAFNNFGELRAAVETYLDRNDELVLSKIPLWANMTHDVLDRLLRHPAAEKTLNYVIRPGDKNIPIPTNLLELKLIRVAETGEVLYWRTLETLADLPLDSNLPTGFARLGNVYVINRAPTRDVNIQYSYFVSPTRMKESGDTNLYLVAAGDAMLYYILKEAHAYLTNFEESQYWEQKAIECLNQLSMQIEREKEAGSSLIYWGGLDNVESYY